LAALLLLSGCERPTHDPSKLIAIRAESETLMKAYSGVTAQSVPKQRWPQAIASLKPDLVSIDVDGVHITTKANFDGGWGYFVPRKDRELPEPAERFEVIGQGVYWWHPY